MLGGSATGQEKCTFTLAGSTKVGSIPARDLDYVQFSRVPAGQWTTYTTKSPTGSGSAPQPVAGVGDQAFLYIDTTAGNTKDSAVINFQKGADQFQIDLTFPPGASRADVSAAMTSLAKLRLGKL